MARSFEQIRTGPATEKRTNPTVSKRWKRLHGYLTVLLRALSAWVA